MSVTESEPAGLRERVEAVAAAVAPLAAEADELSTEIHPGVRRALVESGLGRLTVPARFGGESERVDPVSVCVVREVLMGASCHADTLFAMQGIGSLAIGLAGSDAARERWLPRVATFEAIAALAITEPGAGSDVKALASTLREEGGELVLDGHKSFISNAPAADFFTVIAKEGDEFSLVVVPADAPGVRVEPLPPLLAPHVIGDVRFEGVRLGPEARVGKRGRGMELILATLGTFRVSVAAAAVGLAWSALVEAARHAGERVQFGRPLAKLGPVAGLLADSWAEVESTRLLTYDAAHRARRDPADALDRSSLAKLAATEAASRVVDRCVQVSGRYGLVTGTPLERYYRQSRPMRIYEGASEVLRLGVARRLCAEVAAR